MMTFARMGAKQKAAGRTALRALARTLALAAYFALAFAPLAHGLVHGDHLVEALIDAHHEGRGAPGAAHHEIHCPLYKFCLAPVALGPDAPQIAPLATAHAPDRTPLSLAAPRLAVRDLPRARGPPLA